MWKKLLEALFPADTLVGLTGQHRVSLDGTIASENTLKAPISGFAGVVVEVVVFAGVITSTSRGEQYLSIRRLASKIYAPRAIQLQCPGGVLDVPMSAARFSFFDAGEGIPIDRGLPADLSEEVQRYHHDGPLQARESILAKGHRVHVRGKIVGGERVVDASDYRAVETTPTFTAKDVIITDKSV